MYQILIANMTISLFLFSLKIILPEEMSSGAKAIIFTVSLNVLWQNFAQPN